VTDRLDPVTGTTTTVLTNPVELLTFENRGPSRDPYAYAAPFDIDRMGTHGLYLWVSVPQDAGTPASVRVLCDDQPLELTPARSDIQAAQLSRAPYKSVAPWTSDWYFRLPESALKCLSSAQHMTVTADSTGTPGGRDDRFTADAQALRGFAAFAARHAESR